MNYIEFFFKHTNIIFTRSIHMKQHKHLHSHLHKKNTLKCVPHTKISMMYMWWPITLCIIFNTRFLFIHIKSIYKKKTQTHTHIHIYTNILVGTRDLRTLWSPLVSLNHIHVLVFLETFIFFIFYFYVFSVFIIILYNKNKVFLFHFCIFVYLDASLKFGERRHTSFFFK